MSVKEKIRFLNLGRFSIYTKPAALLFIICCSFSSMAQMFPSQKPYEKGNISTASGPIYYEKSGNPQGEVLIIMNSEPGKKFNPAIKMFFDPLKYNIVQFSHLKLNQLDKVDPVKEVENLLEGLKIKKYSLAGLGWGAAVALNVAVNNPEQLEGLILANLNFMSSDELDQFYVQAQKNAPDAFSEIVRKIGAKSGSKELTASIYTSIQEDQELLNQFRVLNSNAIYQPQHEVSALENTSGEEAVTKCMYLLNNGFVDKEQVFKNLLQLQDIPVYLIIGDKSPFYSVDEMITLKGMLKNSVLDVVPDAGLYDYAIGLALRDGSGWLSKKCSQKLLALK